MKSEHNAKVCCPFCGQEFRADETIYISNLTRLIGDFGMYIVWFVGWSQMNWKTVYQSPLNSWVIVKGLIITISVMLFLIAAVSVDQKSNTQTKKRIATGIAVGSLLPIIPMLWQLLGVLMA